MNEFKFIRTSLDKAAPCCVLGPIGSVGEVVAIDGREVCLVSLIGPGPGLGLWLYHFVERDAAPAEAAAPKKRKARK